MILCLDYGERYVGVAITDVDGKIALRYSVIDRKRPHPTPPLSGRDIGGLLDAIAMIVEDEGITTIVVGVPRSLSGKESDQTHTTLVFVEDVKERFPNVKVETVDETFTSKEAERVIRAEGGSLEDAHAEAARLMLESYLARNSE